jgi:hypothetical protein
MEIELRPRVIIGGFEIMPSREGYVWLCRADGEGGEFEEAKLAACLEDFYRENF